MQTTNRKEMPLRANNKDTTTTTNNNNHNITTTNNINTSNNDKHKRGDGAAVRAPAPGAGLPGQRERRYNITHYPKYDDNVSFQGLLKFAPT